MSKKNKFRQGQSVGQAQSAGLSHQTEYIIIRDDLIKVIVLNVVYLAAILALYYINRNSHAVDNWFAKLLHF